MSKRITALRVCVFICLLLLLMSGLSNCGPVSQPVETGGGNLSDSETQAGTSEIGELESSVSDPDSLSYVYFFKVGKADAILLKSGGKAVMIDAGEENDTVYLLSELERLGVTSLDCLILTHFDNDHIGAVPGILDAIPVGEILTPDYARDSDLYRAVMASAEEHDVLLSSMNADRRLTLGSSALNVWVSSFEGETDPDTGCLVNDGDDNDYSLICEWLCGSVRMLFLGDAEKDLLTEVLDTRTLTVYNLIKLPHHGSYTKALSKLLNRTVPTCTVSCVDNLTAMETQLTQLLSDMGIRSLLTCDGTVQTATDGNVLAVDQ